jgi:hypothetical protein
LDWLFLSPARPFKEAVMIPPAGRERQGRQVSVLRGMQPTSLAHCDWISLVARQMYTERTILTLMTGRDHPVPERGGRGYSRRCPVAVAEH